MEIGDPTGRQHRGRDPGPEENDLIASLDRFVLRRACLDAHSLQQATIDRALTRNVNVSGLELVELGYVARVDEVLQATGWPPRQLVLEVTESVLDVDTPTAIAALHELRARGIRIAVDDFGTGYSSLSRIKTRPTDFLKLDGSFTAAITSDSSAPPLLEAIALLGVALGLPVIAEGVEMHTRRRSSPPSAIYWRKASTLGDRNRARRWSTPWPVDGRNCSADKGVV